MIQGKARILVGLVALLIMGLVIYGVAVLGQKLDKINAENTRAEKRALVKSMIEPAIVHIGNGVYKWHLKVPYGRPWYEAVNNFDTDLAKFIKGHPELSVTNCQVIVRVERYADVPPCQIYIFTKPVLPRSM